MAKEKQYVDAPFPIGLWVTPPLHEMNVERYREIKDAGITLMSGFAEANGGVEALRRSLDLAEEVGLKVLLHDPRVRKAGAAAHAAATGAAAAESAAAATAEAPAQPTLRELLAEFGSHPALIGHNVCDEPSMAQFDELAALAARYREILPEAVPFVNLFPIYATEKQLAGTYAEYLSQFMAQYRPEVLSYDHYPFLTAHGSQLAGLGQGETPSESGGSGNGGGSNDFGQAISPSYYLNLQLIREQALAHGVPFWLFIQTLSFNGTNRDPSEAEMRWQVYTSLAFGAKGLQYFTYWTPDNGVETFGDAMIDRAGNKTVHYYEVQGINRELHAIGPTLLSLTSTGVWFHGFVPQLADSPNGSGDTAVAAGEGSASAVSAGSASIGGMLPAPIASVTGDRAIIGGFEDDRGRPAVLVVNHSFSQGARIALQLDVEYAAEAGEAVSWVRGEQLRIRPGAGGWLELILEPGEGRLIVFP